MVRTGFLVVNSLRCLGLLVSVLGLKAWAMDGCLGSAKAEQEDSQKSKSLWFKIHDQANTHAGCHWGEKFQTTTLARHNFINQVFTQDYMFKKNYIMVVTLAEFFSLNKASQWIMFLFCNVHNHFSCIRVIMEQMRFYMYCLKQKNHPNLF